MGNSDIFAVIDIKYLIKILLHSTEKLDYCFPFYFYRCVTSYAAIFRIPSNCLLSDCFRQF
ncbi:MAG: hypothetical protein CM15mP117_23620 [Alphaproteobacteria bacterium]|nr:MAG: hypothetical protein CM15mP117_23620 [Alphaproteobacteria bacterium]